MCIGPSSRASRNSASSPSTTGCPPSFASLLNGVMERATATSAALSTSAAPSFINLFVPLLLYDVAWPGTANTSLPYSSESLAVIKEPLLCGASTTTTPRETPLIIRFLLGKLYCRGGGGIGDSEDGN